MNNNWSSRSADVTFFLNRYTSRVTFSFILPSCLLKCIMKMNGLFKVMWTLLLLLLFHRRLNHSSCFSVIYISIILTSLLSRHQRLLLKNLHRHTWTCWNEKEVCCVWVWVLDCVWIGHEIPGVALVPWKRLRNTERQKTLDKHPSIIMDHKHSHSSRTFGLALSALRLRHRAKHR